MKILIIKLGALGDVVRTTVLLKKLKGDIFWLSKKNANDLLQSKKIKNKFFIENEEDLKILKETEFDLVINLEEELRILNLLKELKYKKLIGVFLKEEKIDYTSETNRWFDMSRISKLGLEKADELKLKNKKSVPEILYEIIGEKFSGEEYDIGINSKKGKEGKIGLISVGTGIWPTKLWTKYSELFNLLEQKGYKPFHLKLKNTLKEHIEEINSCELIVCGDTLGMHIALALKKPVVALFTCTPPSEIEGYGRMIKLKSNLCEEYLYDRAYHEDSASEISVEEVFDSIEKLLQKNNNN